MLLIFQAMDAAGKDSAIKHVMSGVDPKGCQVYSFKAPSSEELDHDFMWRTSKSLPERGRIGIFNRSYYEETLVVRVHPEYLGSQKLPEGLVTPSIWRERFQDINAFERYLARNGFVIRKFFLNVSRAEQRRRFLERLDRPDKNWKFAMGDLAAAGALARLHGGLRGHHPQHGDAARAVGGHPGGRQEVRADRGRGGGDRRPERARSAVPDARRRPEAGSDPRAAACSISRRGAQSLDSTRVLAYS